MRSLHLGLGRSTVLAATVVVVVLCNPGIEAADLSGVVREVMGEKIAVRIAPDLLPNPGDKVEVFDTVPGLGDIALDCEWQVESIQGDMVLAVTRDKSRATAQPDYKALIRSPNPRRVGSTEATGKPAATVPSRDVKPPDKGSLGDGKSSQVIVGVFDEAPAAAGGVTLDDVVRVNQGVFRGDESSRRLVIPVGFEGEEPWVMQWQVQGALVEFPGGGQAGLYVDTVRCGNANPSPGRRGILYLHPLSAEEPAKIAHSAILSGPSPVLELGVCGNRDVDGDWLLIVTVDGARLGAERLVRGIDGWQDLVYDLSCFSTGEPLLICVEAHANDWRHDYAFFDYIRIRDEIPAEVVAAPVVARVDRVIVEDNFDSENRGKGQAGYDDFQNWYVRGGEVDLLGHGFQDAYPNHGLYVDMDGGGFAAGALQSKGAYRLSAGLYRLQFDLAGNPERTRNTMTVSLGKLYSESFTLDAKEPFRTISREIGVEKAVNASLVFKHAGRDHAGLLLDNISLAAISYPGAGLFPTRRAAYLGVRVAKRVGAGFDIVDVIQDSPAGLAGLRKGDFISLIDGASLAEADLGESQFVEMVSGLPFDRPVRFTIQRDVELLDVWVRPRPQDATTLPSPK